MRPGYLLDSARSSYEDSGQLIEKWHGLGRILYTIAPRFVPTSTPEQLVMAAKLKAEFPTTYIHNHLSENLAECNWVKSLYPEARNYLDVYHRYKLTSNRSMFTHGVHLSYDEFQVLHDTNSAAIFCPTSNIFLGSGLFKLRDAKKKGSEIRIGMGTDMACGGSTSTYSKPLTRHTK